MSQDSYPREVPVQQQSPNPFDPSNPFVALAVTCRELSYSQLIAQRLFRDAGYLTNLSNRLGLAAPLSFETIRTEVSLGDAGRLDVFAQEPGGRVVIVETKVNAQVDRSQQARYVKAARETYGDDTIFLAFKLGPAVVPDCEPEFVLVNSADVLTDLPSGDHLGLRGMLEVFAEVEVRLSQDPIGPRKRRKNGSADALDEFLLTNLSHSFYEFLFAAFKARVDVVLPEHSMLPSFSVTQRGGKILQYFEPSWVDSKRGVQVHFELKDNERIALHVETLPYPSADARLLAGKSTLARELQAALRQLELPDFVLNNLRKNMEREASTTIATLHIDFDDINGSAERFASLFRACAPAIAQAIAPAVAAP